MYRINFNKPDIKAIRPRAIFESTVLKLYKPILSLSFYFGNWPLIFVPSGQNNKNITANPRFIFKLFSFNTLYTTVANLGVTILLLGLQFPNELGNWDFIPKSTERGRLGPYGYDLNKLYIAYGTFNYMIPSSVLISMLLHTACCRSLESFVVGWKEFEINFKVTFNHKRDPFSTLKQIRNRTFAVFAICGFIPQTISVIILIGVWVDGLSLKGLYTGAVVVFMHLPGFGSVLRDLYSIFMFQTVKWAYKEVNIALKSSSVWNCSRNDVERWTRLVHNIRNQIEKIESTLEASGIIDVVYASYFLVATFFDLFTWFSMKDTIEKANHVMFLTGLCIWFSGRLFVKAFIADGIGQEEQLLGNTILLKSNADLNSNSRIEMKFLYDYIAQSPVRIKFGNVIVFEKGLILRILSQVLTYLIVLIQFDRGSRP